jgi:hypothetical protein
MVDERAMSVLKSAIANFVETVLKVRRSDRHHFLNIKCNHAKGAIS